MAVLPLVTWPDPRLLVPSTSVPEVTQEVRTLCVDMVETLHAHEALGLAAVQVGFQLRIFVVDASLAKSPAPLIFINPEVRITGGGLRVEQEGCLSFPGLAAQVLRPKSVKIWAQDLDGSHRLISASGLLARCILHEFDHVEGRVMSGPGGLE